MDEAAIRAGMDVYDSGGRYLGMVTGVYRVPERFGGGPGSGFGCVKVRRGPLPFFGPPPLLVPFDAVRRVSAGEGALTVAATREEAARWAQGRRG